MERNVELWNVVFDFQADKNKVNDSANDRVRLIIFYTSGLAKFNYSVFVEN